MKALIFVLFLITTVKASASEDACFDQLNFKESFSFFEVRSNTEILTNSYYKDGVQKAYLNLLQYIEDSEFESISRKRNFVIVHLTNKEFQDALSKIKNMTDLNGATDFHSSLSQIQYRMYVNHALNKKCNKDYIFVRDMRYIDQNFLHLLAHEMFHILREQKCGNCTRHLWLEEGLAEFVAYKTSGLKPNAAISAFQKIQAPISFFETRPEKFSIAHYGQSFLFLDYVFKNDIQNPMDSLHNGNLKEFIRTGDISCDLVRAFLKLDLFESTNELSCSHWNHLAYQEFILSLLDDSFSRGGPTFSSIGSFNFSGQIEGNYSFAILDVLNQISTAKTPRVQSSLPLHTTILIKTFSSGNFYFPLNEFESRISQIEGIIDAKILIFNFNQTPSLYRVDF